MYISDELGHSFVLTDAMRTWPCWYAAYGSYRWRRTFRI